jgi:hypothetical protein
LVKYYRLWLLSLILISFNLTGPAQAADPPLSLDDYWQKIQETRTLVIGLENAPAQSRSAQLAALADQWAQITLVTLPNGQQMPVNHDFITAQLRADPPDLIRLNDMLTTLLTTRQNWPPAKHQPDDTKVFSDILAQPEFQWPDEQPEQPPPQWLGQFGRRFSQFIAGLLASSLTGYILTGLAILVFLTVLALTLRGLLADFVAESAADLDGEAGGETLTADSAFKRAQRLSNAGDYRTAVRYLYLSSLLILEERGLLRYDRSQTNREYLRSVAHLPRLAALLREVIEVFDRVWYGYQPLDEAAYTRYANQVVKLRQQK